MTKDPMLLPSSEACQEIIFLSTACETTGEKKRQQYGEEE